MRERRFSEERQEKTSRNFIIAVVLATLTTTVISASCHAGASGQDDKKQPITVHHFPNPRNIDELVIAAAAQGDVVQLRTLLEHGANPNYLEAGTTPLVMAAEGGHVEAVRLLLAHGADVTSENGEGETSLDVAETNEKNATDPDVRAKFGGTIVLLKKAEGTVRRNPDDPENFDDLVLSAVDNGDVALLSALFAHGATANFYADAAAGRPPLLVAAEDAHVGVVQFLLAHGANVNGGDPIGNTALDYAEQKQKQATEPALRAKYTEIIAILKKAGGKT